MLEPLHYLTDDRDKDPEDQHTLVIMNGGNGDWYVGVGDINGRASAFVRLCTSGGASSQCPGLAVAVADAYRSMQAAKLGKAHNLPSHAELLEEVETWRQCYPKQTCEDGRIYENGEQVGGV
jgi:hypothetical protein